MPALTRPSKFRHSALIEIGGCPIGLAPSLRYLDAAKLEQVDRAEIEVGVIEGGCCKRTVRAMVENGLVTSIKVDGCGDRKDDEPLHPEVEKLLKAAAREIRKKRRGKPPALPMPVKTFLRKPEALVTLHCYCVCVFGAICYLCCPLPDDHTKYSCTYWG
jgi:hypothetical protein